MSTPATTRKPTTTKSTTRRWGIVPINVSLLTADPKNCFKEFKKRLDDIFQYCFELKK